MSDGRRLAATLWLPINAENNPVPAILEYVPYRRRDGTRFDDNQMHGWFASHGYACARIDLAGTGDSDGLLLDEYLPQEQDDAIEVLAWLAVQPWCNGNVGMIGISWGGFAGLQVAARRPPALKAVVTVCSTVDRFNSDVHFMGGCLLNSNLEWSAVFLDVAGLSPDPAMVGPDWQKRWLERLDALEPPMRWLEHQRRDPYWQHGSVCENYRQIAVPVLAVGGWADGYTGAVFSLVANLKAPCKGIVGPWGHRDPHQGVPGPAIAFLQECKRWWDRWLKGEATGVESDPLLRLWLQDWVPPQPHYDQRPGRWLEVEEWPAKQGRLVEFGLGTGAEPSSVRSPQTTGLAGGEWCPFVFGKIGPEMPSDQQEDDKGSLVFDFDTLQSDLVLVGAPRLILSMAVDQPQALIAVRLSDVSPDGQVTRISYGLLNLCHRDGDAEPQLLEPGRRYAVQTPLKEMAHVLAGGHGLRLSISTSYWPMVWPSPLAATVTIDTASSYLQLPKLDQPRVVEPFAPVEPVPPLSRTVLASGGDSRQVWRDEETGRVIQRVVRNDDSLLIDDIGTEVLYVKTREASIIEDDPLSARESVAITHRLRREGWDTELRTRIGMTCGAVHFMVDAEIEALSEQTPIFGRNFRYQIPRDHM